MCKVQMLDCKFLEDLHLHYFRILLFLHSDCTLSLKKFQSILALCILPSCLTEM